MALEHIVNYFRRDPVEYVPVEIIPAHKIVSQTILENALEKLRQDVLEIVRTGKRVDLRLTIHNLNLHGQRELMSHQVIKWVKLEHVAGSVRFTHYPHRITIVFLGKEYRLKDI